MSCVCKLLCGAILPYSAAYKLCSKSKKSDDLVKMGIGTIHSYNDEPYESDELFMFYISKGRLSQLAGSLQKGLSILERLTR